MMKKLEKGVKKLISLHPPPKKNNVPDTTTKKVSKTDILSTWYFWENGRCFITFIKAGVREWLRTFIPLYYLLYYFILYIICIGRPLIFNPSICFTLCYRETYWDFNLRRLYLFIFTLLLSMVRTNPGKVHFCCVVAGIFEHAASNWNFSYDFSVCHLNGKIFVPHTDGRANEMIGMQTVWQSALSLIIILMHCQPLCIILMHSRLLMHYFTALPVFVIEHF